MFELTFPILSIDGGRLGVQAALLALALDLLFGEPKWLYARVPHPIVWIGALISGLEARLRTRLHGPPGEIALGAVLVVITVMGCAIAGAFVSWLAVQSGYAWIVIGVTGSVFIAARSLHDHVAAVAQGLSQGLPEGRRAVGHIVGRDTAQLDEAGVARASLESLAENFSDGVVAPLFWFLLAGLPGLLAYKAINTLDSMIGHRNERYLYFGRAAARLDDVVNWPAARITGGLLCLAALLTPGMCGSEARRILWRDGGKHASPNAGWPEAAMAGALGVALAGPRVYGSETVAGAWIGDGNGQASAADILRGCKLYRWTCGLIVLALLLGVLLHTNGH